jgi:hypothetical protein
MNKCLTHIRREDSGYRLFFIDQKGQASSCWQSASSNNTNTFPTFLVMTHNAFLENKMVTLTDHYAVIDDHCMLYVPSLLSFYDVVSSFMNTPPSGMTDIQHKACLKFWAKRIEPTDVPAVFQMMLNRKEYRMCDAIAAIFVSGFYNIPRVTYGAMLYCATFLATPSERFNVLCHFMDREYFEFCDVLIDFSI